MRSTISFFLSLLLLTAFSSCKKIDKDEIPSPGKKELLASKVWLLTGTRTNQNTTNIEDNDCSNDMKWVFNSAGEFRQMDGCSNDTSLVGTWNLVESTIHIQTSSASETFTILEISSGTMELKYNDSNDILFRSN